MTHGQLDMKGDTVRSWKKLQPALVVLSEFLKWLRGTYVRNY